MVSFAPGVQPYNFTHMWSFEDLNYSGKGPKPQFCLEKNSVFGYIYNNRNFSRFRGIVEKAGLLAQLSELQADCTLFVPEDRNLQGIPDKFFIDLDDGLARQIVNASILNRRIGSELIKSSPCAYYYTRNPDMKMYVTNIGGKTTINEDLRITEFDRCFSNGVIHIIDGLIIPNDRNFMN